MKAQTIVFVCLVLLVFSISTQIAKSASDVPDISWQRIEYSNDIYYDGLSFDPTGQMLALMDVDTSRISVFDTSTKQVIDEFPTPRIERAPFPSLQWSPDGENFSITGNGNLYILSAAHGMLQPQFAHLAEEHVVASRWARDGEFIAILTQQREKRKFHIVSISDGQPIEVIDMNDNADYVGTTYFDWSPDGNWFVRNYYDFNAGGLTGALGAIRRSNAIRSSVPIPHFDETSCALGWTIEDSSPDIQWSPNSNYVMFAGTYGLALCTLDDGRLTEAISVQYVPQEINARPVPVFPATWSPDARWIIATSSLGPGLAVQDVQCRVRLYDPEEALQIVQIYDEVCIRYSMVWSSDGRYVAGLDSEGVWLGSVDREM